MMQIERGDDAGAHEVHEARHRHHFEGVDLVGDAHGAQLGGEAGAHLSGEGDTGDDRCYLTGVGEAADEPGEGLRADLLETLEALQPHLGAGEERHREDDKDHAAADDERAGADGDVADERGELPGVPAPEDLHRQDVPEDAEIERHLAADLLEHGGEPQAGPSNRQHRVASARAVDPALPVDRRERAGRRPASI